MNVIKINLTFINGTEKTCVYRFVEEFEKMNNMLFSLHGEGTLSFTTCEFTTTYYMERENETYISDLKGIYVNKSNILHVTTEEVEINNNPFEEEE